MYTSKFFLSLNKTSFVFLVSLNLFQFAYFITKLLAIFLTISVIGLICHSFQEPIGHLVLLVQDVLGKSRVVSITIENTDDEAVRSLFKFTDILNSLVHRFSNCDLSHFQLVNI